MKIFSGVDVSNFNYEQLMPKLKKIKSLKIKPKMKVILVGDREDSLLYVKMKKKKCISLGIECELIFFPEESYDDLIIQHIRLYNNDSSIHGILLQLPLPVHMNTNKIVATINPKKDIDGFHYENIGKLTLNENTPYFSPCTALACMNFFDYYNIDIKGKDIIVIGASRVIGLPVSLMCVNRCATVTTCHIYTKNIKEKIKKGDIIISCCGVKHLINKEDVKENAIILDVGITKENKKIYGDINPENMENYIYGMTPVPGGIGPVTISVLIKQLVDACYDQVFNSQSSVPKTLQMS